MKAEDLVFEFLAENDFHPYFVSWIILLLLLSPFWTNIIFWWYAKFWTSRYFIAIQNPRHQIWLLCLPLAKFSYLYIYSIISRNKNNSMSIESKVPKETLENTVIQEIMMQVFHYFAQISATNITLSFYEMFVHSKSSLFDKFKETRFF